MRIAFVILAYSSAEQLERVIDRLDRPHHSFIIHIDKRREQVFADAKARFAHRPNVHFSEQVKVWWGHFNLTLAIVKGMRYLVGAKIDYDYATLLSEADYPIKPVEYMEHVLEQAAGKNFIHYARNDELDHPWVDNGEPGSESWAAKPRMENWHLMVRGRMVLRLRLRRQPPFGFTPYTGWLWWTLSRPCVEYVVRFLDDNPAYLRFFKNVFIADEFFFQTLLLNSPFQETIVKDNLRFAHPEPYPNHIKTVRSEQFDDLAASSGFFARKFDFRRDKALLQKIDEQLLGFSGRRRSMVADQLRWNALVEDTQIEDGQTRESRSLAG